MDAVEIVRLMASATSAMTQFIAASHQLQQALYDNVLSPEERAQVDAEYRAMQSTYQQMHDQITSHAGKAGA